MILPRVYETLTLQICVSMVRSSVKCPSFDFFFATSYITIHNILSTPTTFLIHIIIMYWNFIYFWLHTYARIKHEGKLEKKVGPFAMITSKSKTPGPYCNAINVQRWFWIETNVNEIGTTRRNINPWLENQNATKIWLYSFTSKSWKQLQNTCVSIRFQSVNSTKNISKSYISLKLFTYQR